MGMFDYIRCKYPLPVEGTQDLQYQTKDTDSQYMDEYEIREDGTLWFLSKERECVDDDDAPLGFWIKTLSEEWKQEPITGEIVFYTHWGPDRTPNTGFGQWWIEYSAYFVNGKLQSLNLIEDRRAA